MGIAMEVVSPSLKKLWTEWQLRTLILLSLTLQMVLIFLGHRRKYINKLWINMLVWAAYLAADFVATAALGVITSNLFKNCGPLDADMELTAFWAPFLLLHLGGPDTITAYAVEDNELWPRHLLQFVVQTGVAFYIFLMAWTGSVLSALAIPMMVVGLIKYGERTWVLWSASQQRRRQSISEHYPDEVQNADDREESSSTRSHGEVSTSCALPAEAILDISDHSVCDDEGNNLLVAAYELFGIITKRLFVDAEPTAADLKTSTGVLNRMSLSSPNNGFRVIEMELGFMYDMLYTKAMVTHTLWGIALRFTTFLVTCVVLVSFCSSAYHIQSYSKINLNLTLLLLTVAIFLELCTALVLLLSDQTVVWMRKHKRTTILRAITSLRLFQNPPWSNTMGQYSLVKPLSKSYRTWLLRNLPKACREFSYLSKIEEKLEKEQYEGYRQIPKALKKLMFNYFQKDLLIFLEKIDPSRIVPKRIKPHFRALGGILSIGSNYGSANIAEYIYATAMDFEQTITILHIATEFGYYLDHERMKKNDNEDEVVLFCKMSKYISRYMMYLLITSPNFLPPGEVHSGESAIHQSTCDEVRGLVKKYLISEHATQKERKWKTSNVFEEEALAQGSLVRKAFVLMDPLFQEEEEVERRWKTIWQAWMELLASASFETKGIQHARKLGEGGELLTLAWLLMAHFNYDLVFKRDSIKTMDTKMMKEVKPQRKELAHPTEVVAETGNNA